MLLLDEEGHRVAWGDATRPEPYAALGATEGVALLHADPPYCLLTRRNKRGQRRDPKPAKINHEAVRRFENVRAFKRFTDAWLQHALAGLSPTGHAVIWNNFLGREPIQALMQRRGWHHHGTYQWAKLTRQGSGNERVARLYEVALIFGRAPQPAVGPGDQLPPRHVLTGYDDDGEASTWDSHPNHKPRSVLEPLLRAYSRPGDVVLEPFAGSGSTAAAALALGRLARTLELREPWARTTARRLRAALTEEAPRAH